MWPVSYWPRSYWPAYWGSVAAGAAVAGRPAKRRIEWVPPDVNLDGTPRAPIAEPPRSIKLSKVARKLARVQARSRSVDHDTAAQARAYLDQLRADADGELGRLLARQRHLDEQRRIAAADEEEAVTAFIAWLMEN